MALGEERATYVVRQFQSNEYKATIEKIIPFTENNTPKAIVLMETPIGTCNACEPVIGLSLIEKSNMGWENRATEKCITITGGAGFFINSINKAELVRTGDNTHGLLIQRNYNDYQHSMLAIIDNDKIRPVFSDETGGGFKMLYECEEKPTYCRKFTSTIEFVKGNNPEYRDILVHKKGSKYLGSKNGKGVFEPWEKTFSYIYKDGIYHIKD